MIRETPISSLWVASPGKQKTRRSREPFTQHFFRLLLPSAFLVLTLVSAGCTPRLGVPARAGSGSPRFTAVLPGQSLTLRLENGGTDIVTAGQPYVSALGEECVHINEYPAVGTACLRGGEWIGLPDIFVPQPGAGAGQ